MCVCEGGGEGRGEEARLLQLAEILRPCRSIHTVITPAAPGALLAAAVNALVVLLPLPPSTPVRPFDQCTLYNYRSVGVLRVLFVMRSGDLTLLRPPVLMRGRRPR